MSADFDKAIEHAVREMLDVEPPAGLRRRVIERLPAFAEAPAGKPASGSRLPVSGFVLGPLAAAAVVILAVFLTRSTPRPVETTTVAVQPSVPVPVTTPAAEPPAPEVPVAQPSSHPPSDRRVVAVAAPVDVSFDAPPTPGFPRLPALSVPELSVSAIQRVAPVEEPGAIAPDPIATPSPLAIEPLPAQGRQSQE